MSCPLIKLKDWLGEELSCGNVFPQGAVLCTISKEGLPRSRMVSTMLDEQCNPVFHTSPASRKVEDIEVCKNVSLTYSFQSNLRSISIEGSLRALNNKELDVDWLKFDADFRNHYVVFGSISGSKLTSMKSLIEKRDSLSTNMSESRPDSFIGYRLVNIRRMSFYSVKKGGFAESILYEKHLNGDSWFISNTAP